MNFPPYDPTSLPPDTPSLDVPDVQFYHDDLEKVSIGSNYFSSSGLLASGCNSLTYLGDFEPQRSCAESVASSSSGSHWPAPNLHPKSDVTGERLETPNAKNSIIAAWDYAQDFGPKVIWPPGRAIDNEEFDPEGAMPVVLQSISNLGIVDDPVFKEMGCFYSTFLARYMYDYAAVRNIIMPRVCQRLQLSDSLKHGMLSTAILYRANYEGSMLTARLRKYATEHYLLAARRLELELQSGRSSPWVNLASLIELANYAYHAGNLSDYYYYISQAAVAVRLAIGGNSLDLLTLRGAHTFDVRYFAWCDILHSMALSRPTLLNYESDLHQTDAVGDNHADPDRGIEWVVGCPDILIVLFARITALRHAHLSTEEKITRGSEIEQLIRGLQFRLARARHPILRVARLGAHEIWRHTAILYVHQAVFKSDSSHPVVKDSVKQVIRIASTLKPGVNPDCFLPVPYFIAGFFANSEKDRYNLKNRILGCGNERYLRHLASALDDLWNETDTTGRLVTWSTKQPPAFLF
ncbi:hypothetical protein CTheo_4553 [Ceratobasidium theobromae]|uniref:Transcription factor domain-containing protein n=1 Tax=Ceratobasidium theobromae TaxID=1582974 RepID=A0A5N5QK63_9AGAM|nr:hypothetical protein CTheo_4553 [Ceratobasidium theobromae]